MSIGDWPTFKIHTNNNKWVWVHSMPSLSASESSYYMALYKLNYLLTYLFPG
jgi:hypothetical protein